MLKLKKFLPLLGLAVLLWLLQQTLSIESFDADDCANTRTVRGRHNIQPKYQPRPTLFDDVGLPRSGGDWCNKTAAPCERNAKSCSPCSGGPEGKCLDNGCGAGGQWQNSVTQDCTGPWAPHEPDGTWRIFKKPNYYGWGPAGNWHYGEPFYARAVKY